MSASAGAVDATAASATSGPAGAVDAPVENDHVHAEQLATPVDWSAVQAGAGATNPTLPTTQPANDDEEAPSEISLGSDIPQPAIPGPPPPIIFPVTPTAPPILHSTLAPAPIAPHIEVLDPENTLDGPVITALEAPLDVSNPRLPRVLHPCRIDLLIFRCFSTQLAPNYCMRLAALALFPVDSYLPLVTYRPVSVLGDGEISRLGG